MDALQMTGTDLEWFAYWKDYCVNWLTSLGISRDSLRLRDHDPAELAFYSRATTDIEFQFPFGSGWLTALFAAIFPTSPFAADFPA